MALSDMISANAGLLAASRQAQQQPGPSISVFPDSAIPVRVANPTGEVSVSNLGELAEVVGRLSADLEDVAAAVDRVRSATESIEPADLRGVESRLDALARSVSSLADAVSRQKAPVVNVPQAVLSERPFPLKELAALIPPPYVPDVPEEPTGWYVDERDAKGYPIRIVETYPSCRKVTTIYRDGSQVSSVSTVTEEA